MQTKCQNALQCFRWVAPLVSPNTVSNRWQLWHFCQGPDPHSGSWLATGPHSQRPVPRCRWMYARV